MDIQDKHRVTLLNAKCEVVCKVQSMLKKMDYGEDVSCCSEKLFAAIKLINRLDCYCFSSATVGTTEVLAVYTMVIPLGNYLSGASVTLYVNSIQVAYVLVSVNTPRSEVIESLLAQANISYTLKGGTDFSMTFPCDVINVGAKLIYNNEVVDGAATLLTAGVCAVDPCYNCISDSDLPKAYAVLAALLQ